MKAASPSERRPRRRARARPHLGDHRAGFAQVLADYGAQVVKVEPPEGDVMRHAGAKVEAGMGAMFLHANEGKQSVVIDLKSAAARTRLQAMLPSFDVVIHNIRPQAVRRLGLDEAAVRALHPSVVYVELTGYGDAGPWAGRAAYDDIIQAQVGLADLLARQSGGAPMYLPALIADRVTGLTAAHATLAALYRRRTSGQGETVRVSMFETMAAFVLGDRLGGASFEPAAGPMGYSRLLTRRRPPYRTRDGYLAVVVYTDKHWRSFFELAGDLSTFSPTPASRPPPHGPTTTTPSTPTSPACWRPAPAPNGSHCCRQPTFPAVRSTRSSTCRTIRNCAPSASSTRAGGWPATRCDASRRASGPRARNRRARCPAPRSARRPPN